MMNSIHINITLLPFCLLLGCQQVSDSSPVSEKLSAGPATQSVEITTRDAAEKHSQPDSAEQKSATEPVGFAVVELFTSEGCSSCPPAERLLTEIVAQQSKEHLPIYALEFHVDYWDYLGWPDPFASKDHTNRQRRYAARFKQRSVYTPQMVINGQVGFVGSNRKSANQAIQAALNMSAPIKLQLDRQNRTAPVEICVRYQLSEWKSNWVLNLAVVQRVAQVDVPRGENAGKSLTHSNVVREFVSVPVTKRTGIIHLELPPDLTHKQLHVIGFVQQEQQGSILTAAEAK